MKIWIDFINTPQVSFFIPFLEEFRSRNYQILLTCRDSGNTVELLERNQLDFNIIGTKVGASAFEKAMNFPARVWRLWSYIRKNRPDIAVSQSSFYQPIVARFLGVPCLYTNDNEHARGNYFGFLFSSRVLLPIALKKKRFTKRWPLRNKIDYYPGVKEAIYLSHQPALRKTSEHPKTRIYFRPEPWTAQYYKGPMNFFDDVLIRLSEEYQIVVLPRDKIQMKHYRHDRFSNVTVARRTMKLDEILDDCLLFIGAGGSMSRELAVLDVPVVSIYQAELLEVDKALVDAGRLIVAPKIDYDGIKQVLLNRRSSHDDGKILDDGQISFELVLNQINNLLDA